MSEPKLPSAEELVADWYRTYTGGREPEDSMLAYQSVLALVKEDRRNVLKAAAGIAPESRSHDEPDNDYVQHYHDGWNDACQHIEKKIRKLAEELT